jgi:hypothetical protein
MRRKGFHAAGGFGSNFVWDEDGTPRNRGGGGGGTGGGGDAPGTTPSGWDSAANVAAGAVEGAINAVLPQLISAVQNAKPTTVNYTVAPTFNDDPYATKERREDAARFNADNLKQLLRERDPEVMYQLREIIRESAA